MLSAKSLNYAEKDAMGHVASWSVADVSGTLQAAQNYRYSMTKREWQLAIPLLISFALHVADSCRTFTIPCPCST